MADTETTPETPPANSRPPGAENWPEFAWKRFEEVNNKYKAEKQAREALSSRLEALESKANNPEADQMNADAMAQLETMNQQFTALNERLAASEARNLQLERANYLQSDDVGIKDAKVQSYLLDDYNKTVQATPEGEQAPSFSDWVNAQREHPLYKHVFSQQATTTETDTTESDEATGTETATQPPVTSRPNAGRGSPPPTSSGRYTEEAVNRMAPGDRQKNAKAIAAQLEKEGRIRMSEKLKKRLGWA